MSEKISTHHENKPSRRYELMNQLCGDVKELRERVSRLEQSLLRGLWLLTANLLGVIFSLIQQSINTH